MLPVVIYKDVGWLFQFLMLQQIRFVCSFAKKNSSCVSTLFETCYWLSSVLIAFFVFTYYCRGFRVKKSATLAEFMEILAENLVCFQLSLLYGFYNCVRKLSGNLLEGATNLIIKLEV